MSNKKRTISKDEYDKKVTVELEYYGELDKSSKEDAVKQYLIEKRAKNQAYSFILESGLYNEWEYYFYNGKLKDSADK